jgi:hypothetical protein
MRRKEREERGVAPGRPPAPPTQVPLGVGPLGDALTQHLRIDDKLWPPYDNVRLVRVADDARSAFFVRELASGEKGKEEEVFQSTLDLPADVKKALVTFGRQDRAQPAPENGGESPAGPPSDWQDVPETAQVRPGQYHISRSDYRDFQDNGQRILNEDVGLSSYRSRNGLYEGLKVTKVSPQLARFGVQVGDVILRINGTPVRNKAEAVNVGKRQYREGTRTFVVDLLTGRGEQQTRTYTAPNK